MDYDEGLKARVGELLENLNFYLLHYNRLIAIGYSKRVLDAEIEFLKETLKELSSRV